MKPDGCGVSSLPKGWRTLQHRAVSWPRLLTYSSTRCRITGADTCHPVTLTRIGLLKNKRPSLQLVNCGATSKLLQTRAFRDLIDSESLVSGNQHCGILHRELTAAAQLCASHASPPTQSAGGTYCSDFANCTHQHRVSCGVGQAWNLTETHADEPGSSDQSYKLYDRNRARGRRRREFIH